MSDISLLNRQDMAKGGMGEGLGLTSSNEDKSAGNRAEKISFFSPSIYINHLDAAIHSFILC